MIDLGVCKTYSSLINSGIGPVFARPGLLSPSPALPDLVKNPIFVRLHFARDYNLGASSKEALTRWPFSLIGLLRFGYKTHAS
jgi:hypothetical protein